MSSDKKFKDVKYRKFERGEDGETFTSDQFESPPKPIPWKALLLAFFLFVCGTSLLVVAILLFSGHINSKDYEDGAWPFLTLGTLMFLPGIYHVRIAIYAYKQYPGYSFEDIPDFD